MPNGFGICDHTMSETKGAALGALLHQASKPIGLAFRSDAHTRLSNCSGRHSEDVRVKVVRVNNVDLMCFQEAHESPKLNCEVPIIKTIERVFRDFCKTETLGFGA